MKTVLFALLLTTVTGAASAQDGWGSVSSGWGNSDFGHSSGNPKVIHTNCHGFGGCSYAYGGREPDIIIHGDGRVEDPHGYLDDPRLREKYLPEKYSQW